MKKLFISLFVVAAVSFSACGGSAKTEATTETTTEEVAPVADEAKTLVQQYEELITKSLEVSKKVQGGDVAAAAEMVTVQEEVTKFLEDNKEALEKLTEEEQAEFVKVQEKIAASVAQ